MLVEIIFEESDEMLETVFFEDERELSADFGEVQEANAVGEPYKGEYTVTPKVGMQVIPTKGKYMIDDMTVNPIPVFEVSNSSGGTTVYIAKEM